MPEAQFKVVKELPKSGRRGGGGPRSPLRDFLEAHPGQWVETGKSHPNRGYWQSLGYEVVTRGGVVYIRKPA